MEENLLKYFTGQGEPSTATIQPINITNQRITESTAMSVAHTLTTNDNAYFIRYGGIFQGAIRKNSISVYDADALDNQQPLYHFENQTINNYDFYLMDLRQDEDGRFYGIGTYYDKISRYFLVLFNNFIQDGECYIRKFYTETTMGISVGKRFLNIVKKKNSADYFIYTKTNEIFHFKIDIQSGNSLQTYSLQNGGTISGGSGIIKLDIVGDYLYFLKSTIKTNEFECQKLVIDTTKEIEDLYTTQVVQYENLDTSTVISQNINNFNYYIGYTTSSNILAFYRIGLDGTIQSYNKNITALSNTSCSIMNNYLFEWNGTNLNIYYFDLNNTNIFFNFSSSTFSGTFAEPVMLKKFNLLYFCGLSSTYSIVYSKNLYSIGYSSVPYYNNNFLIPQYLNLYTSTNDYKTVVFSRDVSNRFVAGNQLTATFNVPNYLLNNQTIHREIVNGQTNLSVEDNNKPYSKNRFESLFITYMYNINIRDNTNGDNLLNLEGSNRLADSVWNTLDYQESPCLKARITYNQDGNELIDVISLTAPTISLNTATYTFQVTGNVKKIEYLSADENTVYATYRCDLTGTNTITQVIEVEEK